MDYLRTKIEFIAFMKKVTENLSKNYEKIFRRTENEIAVANFTSLSEKLLSVNDDSFSFLVEKDITYLNIEMLFANEMHYKAMKKLSNKEKQIIFFTVVKDMKAWQVAEIMNTTKESVKVMKYKAIQKFLKNLNKF